MIAVNGAAGGGAAASHRTNQQCTKHLTFRPNSAKTKPKTNCFNYMAPLKLVIITLATTLLLPSSSIITTASSDFVDSSSLKPSLVLILPQSFKVPTNPSQQQEQPKLQQYVALVNNVHNERDNQLIKQQFPKLSLQIRDARSPVTGQLFYEHVFDYFSLDGQQHLLVPIDLDQVSPVHEQVVAPAAALTGALEISRKAQHLIVSVRPHQMSSGFGSDTIEFVSSNPVPVEPVPSVDGRHSFSIVQTDKPVYKPEDKVRIRAMVINENLRPVTKEELRLQVKNPHKIIVEEIRFPDNTTKDQLFLDHMFEFPPEPMQGTWSVHLLHPDPIANDTTSFEVKEYVLPTYEIEFESPKYILPNTQTISGSVVAKYHYGKPVQGKAHLKFGYKVSGETKPNLLARSTIKDIDPITGRAEYRLTVEKFVKELGWFPNIAGSRLYVEATVTEMATGHREISQDASCLFISQPYRFSFADSIEDFKLGLSQQLTVQLIEAQTQRPAPAGVRIMAEYKDQNNTRIGTNESNSTYLETEAYTDSTGRATFNIGPIQDNVKSISVTLRWWNSSTARQLVDDESSSRYNQLAVGQHKLYRHESSNGWISFMNKSIAQLRVGDQFVSDLLIRDALVMPKKIYYTIVARGQIIALENLHQDGLVRFEVTEQMMPSIRIVLFALTHDSVGLLSDSMRINVLQDSGCGLTLRYKSDSITGDSTTTYRPNDKGRLAIRARPGDLVSLMGVDAAVYTLNNRSRLESSKIIERIKRLDTGCGFGGGRNNLDVFHNAGLMLFKNVNDLEPDQLQLGSNCMTIEGQLRHLEDLQLGYSRPMFSAASQLSRPRAAELASTVRGHLLRHSSNSGSTRRRKRRDTEVEAAMRRYKEPQERACCWLGTLEDTPVKRSCQARSQIVQRYTRHLELKTCAKVYLDCCRLVFTEASLAQVGLSFMAGQGREMNVESMIESKSLHPLMSERNPQASMERPSFEELPNLGHLDRLERETLTRKDFRETWLFEIVNVDDKGAALHQIQLPHSITSWAVSAMALNKRQPMCLMPQPLRLTTFQEIFLQVSMPYKVVQGEQIDLVATLFNYSPQSQEVLVYMWGVEDVCSEAEPGERSNRRRVRLARHSSQSLIFPIIPLKTGTYPIKLAAITPQSSLSDIVERQLRVVPRGRPVTDETTFSLDPMNQQRRSKRAIQTGNLVDEIDSARGLQRSKVRLAPTRDYELIVPNTQECIVSAIGDKMGQSVSTTMLDVENLIRLPHGCGEQVMIYLGPTLYTARYLSSINKLTGDLRWRAIRYIQSGYKRILNFRKEGGAFSAFARREPSIWLTAFIAKMLCQTERTPYVADEVHVDRTVINSALEWLVKVQNKENGAWVEVNPVYHREMLGGVLKENALTAFVVIALNECSHHAVDLVEEVPIVSDGGGQHHAQTNGIDRLKIATQRAEQALALDKHRAVTARNPYVLALIAYALSFSRPRDAATALNELLLLSDRSHSRNQLYWRGDYPIETAAYALQALIELAPIVGSQSTQSEPAIGATGGTWMAGTDAVAMANWLASRRSFSGAFESTQDTVVALEALSKFSQFQASPSGNSLIPASLLKNSPVLTCNLTLASNRSKRHIEFGKDNAQILQTIKLESFDIDTMTGEIIDIVTSGNGLGTMSVKLKYNVFQEVDELCRFIIDSSIEEWQPTKINADSAILLLNSGANKDGKNLKTANDTTLDEDYFKNFDQSMLNELNLMVTSGEGSSTKPEPEPLVASASGTPTPTVAQPIILRLKRLAAPSSDPNYLDNLASKVVSSFKTSLPAWLAGSKQQNSPNAMNTTTSKANTSRRSTLGSQVPLIVLPTGIPADAKLNNLSRHIDLTGSDANNKSTTSDNQVVALVPTSGASSTSVKPSHRLVLLLRVCVHHLNSRRDSEMAVIEVGIISGFKPNEADLKEIVNEPNTPAMKYEISADRSMVIIYMHYIPSSGPFCLQFRLVRDSLVYNLQSGYIRVYEYYSPLHSCANFYTPTRVTDLMETKCDQNGQVCQCASRSLCPATQKLLDLGEIHSVNVTSARQQLQELVCSPRYDFVALVRLKHVRYLETGKMFKIGVKVKQDLRGNLTKVMELQLKQEKSWHQASKPTAATNSRRVPAFQLDNQTSNSGSSGDEETSLDLLNLSIDSSCVHNDPFLLHLAHPSQWRQGGELMVLFGRHSKLERRPLKRSPLSAATHQVSTSRRRMSSNSSPPQGEWNFPKPKPNVISGSLTDTNEKIQEAWLSAQAFEDSQQQLQQSQYSSHLLLDRDSILHDLTYQAKLVGREPINSLVSWLELRARREQWSCPKQQDD